MTESRHDPVLQLVALTATTGMIDAVSALGLGKVFVANMTGNIVFLGFAVAGAPGFALGPSLAALVCFLIGAAFGGRLVGTAPRHHLEMLALADAVEGSLLVVAALIVMLAVDPDTAPPVPPMYAIVAFTGIAMGARNATIRRMRIADLTTTVLTLTLTGLAADSPRAGGDGENWRRRMLGVLAMFAGAAAGAVLLMYFGLGLPLLVCAATALVISLTCARAAS